MTARTYEHVRLIGDFTPNERLVIRERHYGHEEASFALLARVFDTTPQAIRSICNATPSRAATGAEALPGSRSLPGSASGVGK